MRAENGQGLIRQALSIHADLQVVAVEVPLAAWHALLGGELDAMGGLPPSRDEIRQVEADARDVRDLVLAVGGRPGGARVDHQHTHPLALFSVRDEDAQSVEQDSQLEGHRSSFLFEWPAKTTLHDGLSPSYK